MPCHLGPTNIVVALVLQQLLVVISDSDSNSHEVMGGQETTPAGILAAGLASIDGEVGYNLQHLLLLQKMVDAKNHV